jgi:uncharacterized small protein (DUF1192 family)
MGNVYLWKVGDHVVYHTDLGAAAQLDGLSRQPDKTVTEEQFSAAGSLVRVINNKIVMGKTAAEVEDEAARVRIAEIDARFAVIEQELIRPIVARLKNKEDKDDTAKFNALTAELDALRAERKEKENSLIYP